LFAAEMRESSKKDKDERLQAAENQEHLTIILKKTCLL